MFCGVAAAGVVLIGDRGADTRARAPGPPPRLRDLAVAARDRKVALGMWLMTVPGLLFGTIYVLAPLRLDELGAGGDRDRGLLPRRRRAGGVREPGRRAPVGPARGAARRRSPAWPPARSMMALLPWPRVRRGRSARWSCSAAPGIGVLWAPAIAMLSDGAEAHGLEQAFAFALVNLAWSVGEGGGAAGSARLADVAGGDAAPYCCWRRCARDVRRAAPHPGSGRRVRH